MIQASLQIKHFNFAHQFRSMLELALVITKSALMRNEFRGSHFKPEFPKRDDANWLKTTIATYRPDEPEISYKPVDVSYIEPVGRDYTGRKKNAPHLEKYPSKHQAAGMSETLFYALTVEHLSISIGKNLSSL